MATCVGGLVGSLIYQLLIGLHHPELDATENLTLDKVQDLELEHSQKECEKQESFKVMQERTT